LGTILDWLKGSQASADPDPNPGIGGYDDPRGPAGQSGFPGSTSWTRENPQAAADKLQNAPLRPVRSPPWGSRVTRTPMMTITQQQAYVIPAPAENGSLPFQGPDAKINPDRVRDTEYRPRIITSQGIPGGERQRNTSYYGGLQAVPGEPHTYLSASKGDGFPVTEVTVPSRYVFNGVNGGTDAMDDILEARRMPYTGHGAGSGLGGLPGYLNHARGSVRGAVLDGNRFFQEPAGFTEGNQGGAYGQRARGSRRHRPVLFAEPAPMNSQFYDTTVNTGTADTPGTNTQVAEQITISPSGRRRRQAWRR
jgi:hypothetical protein